MTQQLPSRPPPQYLPPPPFPPAQVPIAPRRREPQHSPVMAPLLALVGLLLIGIVSIAGFAILGLDFGGGAAAAPGGASEGGNVAVASGAPASSLAPERIIAGPTIAPIVIVAPPGERADIKGTILFSRGGDIWSASGQELRKLSDSNSDTAPTWTSNGKQIYFTRIDRRTTKNGRPGGLYTLYVPDIWRMDADGSNKKRIYSALLRDGRGLWFSHVLEPDISPDGKTLAVISDGPNGEGSAVVLHMLSSKPNSRLRRVQAASYGDLGHNDPEWSPDGRKLAFTRNRNAGTTGVPTIGIFTCKSRKNCTEGKTRLLKSGYANPSWSPDGTWLAVESTRGQGRNIAIVNARKGDPRVVLTRDGNSFAPVVSPDGDQIAYLRRDGLKIDLRVMTLDIAANGRITLVDDRAVTSDGAIDATSTPAWSIPKSQLKSRLDPAEDVDDATLPGEESLAALGP